MVLARIPVSARRPEALAASRKVKGALYLVRAGCRPATDYSTNCTVIHLCTVRTADLFYGYRDASRPTPPCSTSTTLKVVRSGSEKGGSH